MSNKDFQQYKRWSYGAIALSLAICAIAIYFCITRLTVYYDLESFFPQNDPDLAFFQTHQERFEADDNFIYLAIVRSEASIFDQAFLEKVDAFTRRLEQNPAIENASSLTTLREPVYTPFGLNTITTLHIDDPSRYAADSAKIFNDERLINRYVSQNGQTITILMKHQDQLPETGLREMVNSIEKEIAHFQFDEEVRIVGRGKSITSIISAISNEFGFYVGISTILALLTMSFFLRRFWGVLIAITAVMIGLCYFMGLLGATGKYLDVMSPLFPTLMIVVGMSDVIHLLSKYIDEIGEGRTRVEALKITVKEIGMATLLTSTTTAIGFISLTTSNLSAIISFGTYAAIGVMTAYVAVMLFTPAAILHFSPEKLMDVQRHQQSWKKRLGGLHDWVFRNERKILIGSVGLFALCCWGISLISTNITLLSDVPESDRLREDFAFFEEELSGVRVFDVAVEAGDTYKVDEWKVLQEMEKFDQYIKTVPEIGQLTSPLTLYKTLHKANNSGLPRYYQLPEEEKPLKKYRRQLKRNSRKETSLLISEDRKHGRMTANMVDIGSDKITKLYLQINQWIENEIDPSILKIRLTGTALIMDKNHEQLRVNLLYGLGLAFLVVSILMMLLFRSIKMAFIALIPNLFPLLIAGGVMGFLGISLKASTSIIFTIAFGIAVDDTIHFLSKFRLQRQKGQTVDAAIHSTFMETGKALCLTTFILFAGFFVLVSSDFNATFYVGLLISITLISALIADLILLPICLKKLIQEKKQDNDSNA